MKLKQGTDLTKYGFKQWPSGVWYIDCPVIERTVDNTELGTDMSIIVQDDEVQLYHTTELYDTKNKWLDSVYEIPSVLIKMIKDGVLEEKDE